MLDFGREVIGRRDEGGGSDGARDRPSDWNGSHAHSRVQAYRGRRPLREVIQTAAVLRRRHQKERPRSQKDDLRSKIANRKRRTNYWNNFIEPKQCTEWDWRTANCYQHFRMTSLGYFLDNFFYQIEVCLFLSLFLISEKLLKIRIKLSSWNRLNHSRCMQSHCVFYHSQHLKKIKKKNSNKAPFNGCIFSIKGNPNHAGFSNLLFEFVLKWRLWWF